MPSPIANGRPTNFGVAFAVLPRAKRNAIRAVHAWSRSVDDDVDEAADATLAGGSIERWRREIDLLYDGHPEEPVTQALAPHIQRFGIPRIYLEELVTGIEMDLIHARYGTFRELARYCYRVASVVGLICLRIFGDDEERGRGYAVDLGVALQLTNILRDVGVDHARGRIYLPAEDRERFGYSEEALLASTFQDITHPDDLDTDLEHVGAMLAGKIRTYEMEKRYFRADGSVMWVLLSVALVRDADGFPRYFVSQIQDIDERKREQGELERLANRDALTGTLNRRAWDNALASAIVRAEHADEPLSIALIDLNGFKEVNDSFGHDSGDRLLTDAAKVWQEQLRGGDLLARIGGDEFGVLLPNCAAADLDAIAERLKGALWHDAGCGVGTAVWRPGDGAAALMRRADAALYADKANGD